FVGAVADGERLRAGERLAQELRGDHAVALLLLDHELRDHGRLKRAAAEPHWARHYADEADGARAFHRHPGGQPLVHPGVAEEHLVEVSLAFDGRIPVGTRIDPREKLRDCRNIPGREGTDACHAGISYDAGDSRCLFGVRPMAVMNCTTPAATQLLAAQREAGGRIIQPMKRAAVYSRSGRASGGAGVPVPPPAAPAQPPVSWRKRHGRRLKIAGGVVGGLLALAVLWNMLPPAGMTPQQVEAMVQKVLDSQQPAPTVADAYESILPSVVLVRGLPDAPDADVASGGEAQSGSGVVIVDSGVILTNLHVVNGAKAIKVVFHDGLESDAIVTGVQPEHDLAVLQAKTIPDDLEAATLRSTQ